MRTLLFFGVLRKISPFLTKPSLRYFTGNSKSARWFKEHTTDPYVRQAIESKYRSRAAFKLIEIDDRYHILRNSKRILELGCAPGSWTQVAMQRCQNNTKVLGIDKEPVQPIEEKNNLVDVVFKEADVFNKQTLVSIFQHFEGGKIDLLLSDLSPGIIGESAIDSEEIVETNRRCIEIAEAVLCTGGTLLMKTFKGIFEQVAFEYAKFYFKEVLRIKPSASRMRSPELYYLCGGFKKTPFWKFVEKKGYDVTFEDLQEFVPQAKNLTDEQLEKFQKMIALMLKNKQLDKSDFKFTFEKELLEKAEMMATTETMNEPEFDDLSLEEQKSWIEEMYDRAVENKLAAYVPRDCAENNALYEKEKAAIEKDINSLLKKEKHKFEVLDLDEDIKNRNKEKEEQLDESSELATDFKHFWEPGYEDYLISCLKKEVIEPMARDPNYNLSQHNSLYDEEQLELKRQIQDLDKEQLEIKEELAEEDKKEEFSNKMLEYQNDPKMQKKLRNKQEEEEYITKSAKNLRELEERNNKDKMMYNKNENKKQTKRFDRADRFKEMAHTRAEKSKDINKQNKKRN